MTTYNDVKQWRKDNPDKYREQVKRRNAKWHPIYGPRRIRFKGKRIQLKDNPRTGICKQCDRKGLTHIHHTQYDEYNPMKYTIELCVSCHAYETWSDRY